MPGIVEKHTEDLTCKMSPDERDQIRRQAIDAYNRGDTERGHALLEKIPASPAMAKFWNETVGADFCREYLNLADANTKYGEGWLNG